MGEFLFTHRLLSVGLYIGLEVASVLLFVLWEHLFARTALEFYEFDDPKERIRLSGGTRDEYARLFREFRGRCVLWCGLILLWDEGPGPVFSKVVASRVAFGACVGFAMVPVMIRVINLIASAMAVRQHSMPLGGKLLVTMRSQRLRQAQTTLVQTMVLAIGLLETRAPFLVGGVAGCVLLACWALYLALRTPETRLPSPDETSGPDKKTTRKGSGAKR